MPTRTGKSGSELFVVDNSDADWKVADYLREWCQISKAIDIATGYFEIGSLLSLNDEWQKTDQIRILMGDEVSLRTQRAFQSAVEKVKGTLDASLEKEKDRNDFLTGVPAIVEGIRSGKIACRVYRRDKFHAKAYITHSRLEVVGSSALVGSSNFTYPGLHDNIELNIQITGRQVGVLQDWYDEHWDAAEDVTPDILRVCERQTAPYSPFEIYAKALQAYFRGHQLTVGEWETAASKVYPVLDKYQQDGYQNLMKIAERFGGAFLCDGVGLGKTFIGLMLIERFVVKERKNVLLLVPKGGRVSVWEPAIRRYLRHIRGGDFSNLAVLNHTDLNREGDFPERLAAIREKADVIIIDEAHHFRNPGRRGGVGRVAMAEDRPGLIKPEEAGRPSRYWKLYEIAEGKQMFFLTATPINNQLDDLRHVMELFTREQAAYFASTLGVHSLVGHFRQLDKELDRSVPPTTSGVAKEVNLEEAKEVLSRSPLFNELVVQRSRKYVVDSQKLAGVPQALFPDRQPPQVAAYSVAKTFGPLLKKIERAFDKQKPLFALSIYYPLAYWRGADPKDVFQNARQQQVVALIRTQFLKRFESSPSAFEVSCERLLLKLLTFVSRYAESPAEKRRLKRWLDQNEELIERVRKHLPTSEGDEEGDEESEDVVTPEMLEDVEDLSRQDYDLDQILDETYLDLEQISEFIDEFENFTPSRDDKLNRLITLLKTDPVLKQHKVLVFSEFADTARYLRKHLIAAGIDGVEEIDGDSDVDRAEVIRRFAPYYNESSSALIRGTGEQEIRVLISTDILAEGLNLQDVTRLINFDLHWNPVRLMQRIGRVDRRMNPEVEARMIADHPEQTALRGKVAYWNFLPPQELDGLLRLYSRVANKTLRISKTFGIEGKQLLRPEDDFEALREFNAAYEGTPSWAETLHLELQRILSEHPGLETRLNGLPGRVFSGKQHPRPETKAVFFCYALPALQHGVGGGSETTATWSDEVGPVQWYVVDLSTGTIREDAQAIVDIIRTQPDEPRRCVTERQTLSEIRQKVEKHIKNTYLKRVQAPVGVGPTLVTWMELN